MATITHIITVSDGTNEFGSGNKYYIDGKVTPQLRFIPGNTYIFDISDISNAGHVLRFSTTYDGTHNDGIVYAFGTSIQGTAGTPGANIQIDIIDTTPNLYYYCVNHEHMGGSASLSLSPPDSENNQLANCSGEPFISKCNESEIAVGNNINFSEDIWTNTHMVIYPGDVLTVSVRGCICSKSLSLLSENNEPIRLLDQSLILTETDDTCSSVQGIPNTNQNRLFGTILPDGIKPSVLNQLDIDLSPSKPNTNKLYTAKKNGFLWLLPYSNDFNNDNNYVYCVNIKL